MRWLPVMSLALTLGCGDDSDDDGGSGSGSGDSQSESEAGSGSEAESGTGTASGSGGSGGSGGACEEGTCRLSENGPCEEPTGPTGNGCCECGSDDLCAERCMCAAPDTPIATPDGERPIASLRVGDLVYSVDDSETVAVPIRETHRSPVYDHTVVRVELDDGPVLEISPAHPTADGRSFADLETRDRLGSHDVASATLVPYGDSFTYDILPDSATGAYFAAGALIGSTLQARLPAECSLARVEAQQPGISVEGRDVTRPM